MKENTIPAKTVDEYISKYPEEVQVILQRFRNTIQKAAPKAEETISYRMPAFKQDGMLVYFAGWKTHVGFYPVSSAIREFERELTEYESSKGTVKFPIDRPVPFRLISRIVKFRVKENQANALAKVKKKK
jgi:uncharacterized protein YdhG (YjbR/CyaY superfamily)